MPDIKPVLVIGDAMIDSYKACAMERISPEAPVPVLRFKEQFYRLGGAANVAAGLTAMDTPCDLIALAGDDPERALLAQMLAEAGVGDRVQPVPGWPTIQKERILAMNQQVCRIDRETKFDRAASDSALAKAAQIAGNYGFVVVSDYDKGCTRALPGFLQAVAGTPVLIDPKTSDWSLYAGAWLIKPNHKEFVEAARFDRLIGAKETIDAADPGALNAVAQQLMEKHQITHLVLTLGAQGYLHAQAGAGYSAGPTKAREVFDLSGAGDTFLAALTAALAQGDPLERAIAQGNTAAGIAVGRLGTCIITSADLAAAGAGAQDDTSTLAAIHSLAASGKRIVFTNGCFDILHPGHLATFETSKAAGDVLVVGLNTDASVARLKGPTRPVVPLEDRMAMVEALKPVDFVLSFDEDTPARLIETVAPDVLVKGGDYTIDTIVGADFVQARGGEVLIVPIKEGRSTSNIVAKASCQGKDPT